MNEQQRQNQSFIKQIELCKMWNLFLIEVKNLKNGFQTELIT